MKKIKEEEEEKKKKKKKQKRSNTSKTYQIWLHCTNSYVQD
jgi:hypothetical protein